MRGGEADTRQEDRETVFVEPARRVHRPRVAAQQPAERFEHAQPRRRTERASVLGQRIEHDRNERELAVLARREVDLAPQLVVEVNSLVQAGDVVAQCLVLRFAAQRFARDLLLLELLQRVGELLVALARCRRLDPHAAQMARRGTGRDRQHDASHVEVAALPITLDTVLGGERQGLRERRLLGRAQRRRQLRAEQLEVGLADHLLGRTAIDRGHSQVDVDVAARRNFLDRERRFEALDEAEQHRTEAALDEPERCDQFARAGSLFGRR